MAPDVLILAAFAPELAPLAVALGDSMSASIGGRSIEARIAGIGLAAAAVGAAGHLGELMPRAALLVGTCGAYPGSGLAIGDVVVARRLLLVDPAAIAGAAQFPEPMTIAAPVHDALTEAFAALGARSCSVGTTLAITVDDAGATRIAEATGAEVEHLEAQGVAMACAARAVPFAAILVVANVVGSRGRAEWRENHVRAETLAGERVLQWLQQGARGLPT